MFIQIEYMSLFKDKKLSTRISLTSFTTFLTCFNWLVQRCKFKINKSKIHIHNHFSNWLRKPPRYIHLDTFISSPISMVTMSVLLIHDKRYSIRVESVPPNPFIVQPPTFVSIAWSNLQVCWFGSEICTYIKCGLN